MSAAAFCFDQAALYSSQAARHAVKTSNTDEPHTSCRCQTVKAVTVKQILTDYNSQTVYYSGPIIIFLNGGVSGETATITMSACSFFKGYTV